MDIFCGRILNGSRYKEKIHSLQCSQEVIVCYKQFYYIRNGYIGYQKHGFWKSRGEIVLKVEKWTDM